MYVRFCVHVWYIGVRGVLLAFCMHLGILVSKCLRVLYAFLVCRYLSMCRVFVVGHVKYEV